MAEGGGQGGEGRSGSRPEEVQQNEVKQKRIPDLIEDLRQPFCAERHRAEFGLLELSIDQPDSVAEHLLSLFEVCEANGKAARWAAAAAIGNVTERNPTAVAPQTDRLVAALDSDSDYVRESVSSALVQLVATIEIPVSPLFDRLEAGEGRTAEVVDILSKIAIVQPATVPVPRLEELAESSDGAVRVSAEHLLTLLAAVGRCDPPYRPTAPGFQAYSKQVRENLPEGDANQFLVYTLLRNAIDQYLAAELAGAGYLGMDVAKTSEGTMLQIRTEDPEAVLEECADVVPELSSELETRFGLQDLRIGW